MELRLSSDDLELAFADRSIRDICEIQLKAEHALGLLVARNLRARLADLKEASSPRDVVAGNPEILSNISPGRISVALEEAYCLIFCANHVSNPISEKGEVQWDLVERIKILEIGVAKNG